MAAERVPGLSTIVRAARLICRIAQVFGPTLRPRLSTQAQAAYDALIAACALFDAVLPEPD